MSSTNQILFGTDEVEPARRVFRAGRLQAELDGRGNLSAITFDGIEILRGIAFLVRNKDWGTFAAECSGLQAQETADGFSVTYHATCRDGENLLQCQAHIEGHGEGTLRFSAKMTPTADFITNRAGFIVLHGLQGIAGAPVDIEHTDGSKETVTLPRHVRSDQPLFDLAAVTHHPDPGLAVTVRFQGDVFEMEDQRNWTDASFKTYCTPLALPLPHQVRKGDRVQQAVTVSLAGHVRSILPVNVGRSPQLSLQTTPVLPLPPLGLAMASHGRPLSPLEVERLKALRLSHLRVDLSPADPELAARLEQAVTESHALGCGLHIALMLDPQMDARRPGFIQLLERFKPRVLLWILLHESENPTSEQTVERVRPALQKMAPHALFAAGTRDFFTEINRVRLEPGATSSLCYSNNPQVHAFDNITMVENLAGQVYNVESARAFTARPVIVSPITLRIRNQAGAAAERPGALTDLPSDVDPRQLSLFGAGWTLGSIARLAATGFVHSLTYFETTGWRGLMETALGSPLPAHFPSEAGAVFPVYHVFADIAEFNGRQIHPTQSTHPLLADGLTLVNSAGDRRILVANLTGDVQELKIKSGPGTARVRHLDETTAAEAMRRPEAFRQQTGVPQESVSGMIELKLLPFALARVDISTP